MSKSPKLIFFNGAVVLPDAVAEGQVVTCRDDRIDSIEAMETLGTVTDARMIDLEGGYVTPGYIDLHVHGGAGADFMDGTPEAVRTANRAHARHGTTTIFPTTTTGSIAQLEAMLRSCQEVKATWSVQDGPHIAGVHFYGPYFAPDKVGCHLKSGQRAPDPAEYEKFFDMGIIQVATCAAELPGAVEYFQAGRERGYLLTCGHSNASWSEMQAAFDAGMRHVDHFWCAMSSVSSVRDRLGTPMQGSMNEFVLFEKEMSTEVIADGEHLSSELLRFAHAMKGPQRICLVTDCNRALDLPPGRYRFGPEADGEFFESDGKVGRQPGAGLASSIVGMDTMVRNMHKIGGVPLADAVRMGSLTPAARAGIDAETGSIETGKRADLLVLDAELKIKRVFIGGAEFEFGA